MAFILRSWTGRRIFQLRSDTLTVSGEYFGQKSIQEIPLRSISPDYQRQAQRFSLLIVVPLILGALCLTLVVWLLTADNEVVQALATYPAIFFIASIVTAFRGVPRTDFFVFSDHWKQPLLSVVRDPKQAKEFDTFVHELLDRIERIERDLPPTAANPVAPTMVSAVSVPTLDDADSGAPSEWRWLASVIAGALSAAFPWLPKVAPIFDPLVFPVVFFASVGGLCWGIGSFMGKEPRRPWSILSLVLSVIAPVFY